MQGSVLGVDVGWSRVRRSSAACRLDWDEHTVRWRIARFTAEPAEQGAVLADVMGDVQLLAAAFDGPLSGDLAPIESYRLAERRLSERWAREAIGKIGQSNSGSGRLLNAATHACAQVVIEHGTMLAARHAHAIHPLAIAEAFPNSFLGLMLDDPAPHKGGRGQRSDRYYVALERDGTLARLIAHALPRRRLTSALAAVTNHDDRAALACALSALCVASSDYLAVGEAGAWIILPPMAMIAPWARPSVAGWNQRGEPLL